MLIRLGYEIAIECAGSTPIISLLDIHRDRQADIKRQTRVLTSPSVPTRVYHDRHGNSCRRFTAPAGGFRILYDAVIEDSGEPDEVNTLARETPVAELPDDVLVYLLGSRYCETDHLSDLAWQRFGNLPPGWARAQAIVDYVHSRLSFGYGYARATRTAAQAHEERVGVCRDFAHLAIALCRAMNMPARYVNGYLGDIGVPVDPAPMDFSAWLEVFLDGKWYTFDPRHNIPRIGRVVIARGRDATDVPLLHSFGQHQLKLFKVWTYEQERNLFSPPHHNVDRTVSAQMLA
ncbi:transglutaminase family protein [Mesorhizobium sp. M4A.F.Ca.ET.020.02.1.1]|uniref:transglutaminase-like domain-containing protein n=1 Tax=unclassified Mesorhizobium TaxID=325217 RepID=UPI000FCC1BF6|nr:MULTISPECIES: transglutaminase family protein [unclassified Mesorhizobium]RUX51164.1 transglutaminase family protein [Mesorhizobium sp. M4A.F.Ca.ET.050.02.1.1]RVD41473.1 transglutaminase family protein [Mesorhizobium sp. M4A.F.Ca.ET.020.02.1.1]RWC21110.1 MAG: transglutaminase family protein [Mesorhizobium sp.]RWD29047.1 MAG: transglutaminase family protein [Mesorhizobium sp.]RWD33856.1 MAG: transglutaminase family protein [Mesorhizobium sp.]